MSHSQANIEMQVLKLPRSERAKIALHLLDSLEQEQSPASRDVIEQAWIEESVRRLEAYHRGEMEAYPADEVIAEPDKNGRILPTCLRMGYTFPKKYLRKW